MVPNMSNDPGVCGDPPTGRRGCKLAKRWLMCFAVIGWCSPSLRARAADQPALARYSNDVQPLLEQYCYGCHGMGAKKGGVALDAFSDAKAALNAPKIWHAVLKNVRSGIMPPSDKPQPSAEERRVLEDWIKYGAFGIDPKDPDPGRVTVRRLNRVEYRNTIRDLTGVIYDTTAEFPPDDTGHGFDNNGDVLTLSPLLLEKYLSAANAIISRAVPTDPKIAPVQVIPGRSFRPDGSQAGERDTGPVTLSYYEVVDGLGRRHGRARRPISADPGPDGERTIRQRRERLQPLPAPVPRRRRGTLPPRIRPAGEPAMAPRIRSRLEGRAAHADGRGAAAHAGPEAGQVAVVSDPVGDRARADGPALLGPLARS